MRINVVLDNKLVEEALRLSHKRTMKEIIHEAHKEYVDVRKRLDLADLAGRIHFREDYDYKSMPEGK